MTIMHIWQVGIKGHSGEIAGRYTVRPLFHLFWVFSFVETLYIGSGVSSYGIFGSVGLGILDLDPWEFLLSCSKSVVDLLMVILLLNLVLTFLLWLSID